MNAQLHRRRFLKLGAQASLLSLSASFCPVGFGQDLEAAAEQDSPLAPQLPTKRVPGLNAVEIRLGMSADFTGRDAAISIDALRGALAWLDEVNARGGIEGRRLTLLAQDDGGDPRNGVHNVRTLLDTHEVFCLFNFLGTRVLGQVLPILHGLRASDIWLLGEISGAHAQRTAPYASQVFPVRASHRQEMLALVKALNDNLGASSGAARGGTRFGLFYPITPHGRSGADAAQRAITETGGRLLAEATWRPGPAEDRYLEPAIDHLRSNGVEAVICLSDGGVATRFLSAAGTAGWVIASGIGATLDCDGWYQGLESLPEDPPILTSRTMPFLDEAGRPALEELRRLLQRLRPKAPPELTTRSVPGDRLSAATLEGFLHARLLTAGLELAGAWPTRANVRSALESLRSYDLGIGAPLSFSGSAPRGLDVVYLARWAGGRFRPLAAARSTTAESGAADSPDLNVPEQDLPTSSDAESDESI